MSRDTFDLAGYHPLISCEGTVEQVAVEILLAADALVFPEADVVDVTRLRRAADIQVEYLNYDYDWPVCIVRVLDSRKERFKLNNLYAERFPVVSYVTHPEMEVLAIIREDAWGRWHGSHVKPSDFCKRELGMREIKRADFLRGYWDADALTAAAREYRRLSKIPKGELCLADLIR
ncbi:hypothetical protein [Adlercreutzia sp. ZJ138]|uniref:hypothetical protein n=1 Tax=Adlercreutzia sp. ZJ138 TaxID=2709405 RepID=UPI0013EA6189|nr:hypothetical protein [Adlercreutzia sp. ZJ138]